MIIEKEIDFQIGNYIITEEQIDNMIESVKIKIAVNCFFGELYNTDLSTSLLTYDVDVVNLWTVVNLSKTSHTVKQIKKEDNKYIATVELIDTPTGIIAKQLVADLSIDAIKLKPRIIGNINSDNTIYNPELITIDIDFVK